MDRFLYDNGHRHERVNEVEHYQLKKIDGKGFNQFEWQNDLVWN